MKRIVLTLQLRLLLLVMLLVITSCISEVKPGQLVNRPFMANVTLKGRVSTATLPSVPAFPGAEGFGANSVGGRGGRVIEVTNLNDSGSGSLRAAIEAEGPRIVVFRTGGTIELQSVLEVFNPYITIAGQTAPGGGITLKTDPASDDPLISVATHDVTIRYLRSRPGPSIEPASSLDALEIIGGYNIIIDHGSFSWATDEVISTWYAPHDITIQWSIISEGLAYSTHEEGPHSAGMLLGAEGSYNISIHHNLFAHNYERNPRIKTSGVVDVVNNVIYNPGFNGSWGPSHISDDYVTVPVNYIGNYYKPGVNSGSADYLVSSSDSAEIFLEGNLVPKDVIRPEDQEWVVETPYAAAPVTTTSAQKAYEQVLANAGANAPLRDTVDQRIINDVINGTGKIINDPSDVGGWPQLVPGIPPADTDHDGMPDEWENLHCFNPNDPADGPTDADGDGYTNVEEYLNGDTLIREIVNLDPIEPNFFIFLPLILKDPTSHSC